MGRYTPNETNSSNRPKTRAWKIGNERRKSMSNENPGPGSYNALKFMGSGPKAIFAQKYSLLFKQIFPGPGSYNPNEDTSSKHRRAFSLRCGKEEKIPICKSSFLINPGPGMYSSKSTLRGPKYM